MLQSTTDVKIINRRGLHARASAKFVRMAENLDADILVSKDGVEVCGTSIMGLMLLAAAQGDTITITAKGQNCEDALQSLVHLIGDRFEEDH